MLVVSAVALGAATGLTEATTAAVKDAYAGLKALLGRRRVDVSGVERKPESVAQQAALQETLTDTPDAVDDELLQAARAVTEAVAAEQPGAAAAVGVDLERVRAEFLRVGTVRSTGTGVRVRDGEFTGGIDIGQVDAGRPADGAAGPSGR